jgi:hypothetical protein
VETVVALLELVVVAVEQIVVVTCQVVEPAVLPGVGALLEPSLPVVVEGLHQERISVVAVVDLAVAEPGELAGADQTVVVEEGLREPYAVAEVGPHLEQIFVVAVVECPAVQTVAAVEEAVEQTVVVVVVVVVVVLFVVVEEGEVG